MSFSPTLSARPPRIALAVAALLLVAELGGIGLIFKHGITFTCLDNWPALACRGSSRTLVALYCVLGTLALLAMLRPEPFRTLVGAAGERLWPLALNGAGVALALVPMALLREGGGAAALWPSLGAWVAGMALILVGLGLYLAPAARWRAFLAEAWPNLLLVTAAGAAAPWLAVLIRPLWRIEAIADATFRAVAAIIGFLGYEVTADPARKIIGTDAFSISVAPVCSGIEGIALVTLFVTLYLVLFRRDLRFPRALLLYPLGIAASALLNVVRIAALLVIGLEGNPALAVGGFHSHAGWLMFTLVALAIVALAQTVPALKTAAVPRATAHAPLPFLRDPVVARILPFAVFMATALAASTLTAQPGVVYPLRMLALTAVVLAFAPLYRHLPWRIDPWAVGVGAAVGLMWVMIPVAPAEAPPHGALAGGLLVLWFVVRGLGTVLLVPLVEELFFRDYLEGRLRIGTGRAWAIFAALVTAALFAALHDRWAEALVAGLAFSALARRQGNITDAILAHAVANLIVYAVAIATGNLAII